jgi:perosamine synthetase
MSRLLSKIQIGDQRFDYYRGRVALFALLKGLGITAGQEVATQAFTCVAVPEAIMAAGARPVYVDIEPVGFNMDACDLAQKLTPRVRAIIVQHTYGIPADMDCILEVANAAKLPIIEDCCHTLATIYKGKRVGSFGVGSFYSFEWGKPVVIGIGGSAIVNEPSLWDKLKQQYKQYRYPGMGTQAKLQMQYVAYRLFYRPWLFWPLRSLYHVLGSLGATETNYNPLSPGQVAKDFSLRMPKPLQQRLERKIADLDALIQQSRKISADYKALIESPSVKHLVCPKGSDTVFARYPLVAHDKPALLAKARKVSIELADWYSTPIYPLSSKDWQIVHYEAGTCPQAEARCNHVVTLPVHSGVSKRNVERIIRFLNKQGI